MCLIGECIERAQRIVVTVAQCVSLRNLQSALRDVARVRIRVVLGSALGQ